MKFFNFFLDITTMSFEPDLSNPLDHSCTVCKEKGITISGKVIGGSSEDSYEGDVYWILKKMSFNCHFGCFPKIQKHFQREDAKGKFKILPESQYVYYYDAKTEGWLRIPLFSDI
jgi:hypothetical protein